MTTNNPTPRTRKFISGSWLVAALKRQRQRRPEVDPTDDIEIAQDAAGTWQVTWTPRARPTRRVFVNEHDAHAFALTLRYGSPA